MVLWETHQGLCIKDEEINGYDDSDFIMTVWDPELKAPKRICYATTRAWTYPSMASKVDATQETLDAYREYLENIEVNTIAAERKSRALALSDLRQRAKGISKKHGVPYHRVLMIVKGPYGDGMVQLLTKNIRSPFRISLREQVLKWLVTPNGYSSPLSVRQLQWL